MASFIAVWSGESLPLPFAGRGGGKSFVLGEKGIVFHRLINCVERILKFEYSFTLLLYLIQHAFDISNTKLRNNLRNYETNLPPRVRLDHSISITRKGSVSFSSALRFCQVRKDCQNVVCQKILPGQDPNYWGYL